MNQIAAAFAPPASSGANVGPEGGHQLALQRAGARGAEPDDGDRDEVQRRHAGGRVDGRGTLRSGSIVSPTWQVAASKAGAAKPMRYSPAIALVIARTGPERRHEWKDVARSQSTVPETTGTRAEQREERARAARSGPRRGRPRGRR
jgi:hypothetical protein